MKKLLVSMIVSAIVIIPVGARAVPGGCTATPNAPKCTYTAVGNEIARGGASSTLQSGWQAWVIRTVDGTPTKVVLASGSSLTEVTPEGVPVLASLGELVTLEILLGNNDLYPGIVNIGNP